MKPKITTISFLFLLILLANVGLAQNRSYFKPLERNQRFGNQKLQRNILKVEPTKLIIGGINLSYERLLTKSMSVNLRAKYHSLGFIERNIDGFEVSGDNYSFGLSERPRFYHWGIDAEYRFYIKNKKAGSGFYIAPYGRCFNYTGSIESLYSTTVLDKPVKIDGDLKTSIGALGAGVQLGAQWLIKDKVSIDWGFAGLGIDRYVFEVGVKSDNLNNTIDKYTTDLQNVLGEVSGFLTRKIAFNALDNELSSKVPFWMVGFKSSITVGIVF
jgi:hypothetical protein